MKAPYISGSALSLATKCGPSQVLPRVRRIGGKDRPGSALHEHLHHRNHYGVDEALRLLPDVCARHELHGDETDIVIARARAFTWKPPRGAGSEVALCFMEDGSVRRVKGGRGHYPELPDGGLVPTQVDLFWSEPDPLALGSDGVPQCPPGSVLWVIDYKTGSDQYPDPVERNAQILAGAHNVARWTRAALVMPAIIYVRRGQGEWDVPDRPLDAAALDSVAGSMRRASANVLEQKRRFAAGETLSYVTGPHCTFCDASQFCEAKTGAIRRFLDDPIPLASRGVSDDQARRMAELLPSMESFIAQAKEFLVDRVTRRGPIELADGRRWGPHEVTRDVIAPDAVVAALEVEVGPELARAAVTTIRKTSKAAIEEAVKSSHEARGIVRKRAPAVRAVFARLHEAGGIKKRKETWWSAYRPTDATPAEIANAEVPRRALPPDPGEEVDGDD